MSVTLYLIPPSPPGHAVRLMLELKGLEHRIVTLLPGLHPALLRTRGFHGGTVPALKINGRRLQNSRQISRAFEEIKPEPALFPSDPERRLAVEEAERWGEEELQDLPRRIIRWLASHRQEARTVIARDSGVPLPELFARMSVPTARYMAARVDAEGQIRRAIADTPDYLDHIDELIAQGVIGGEQPNAADFQIGTSVRSLVTIRDLQPAFEGRPATELARRILPELGSDFRAGLLPAEFLAPLSGRPVATG